MAEIRTYYHPAVESVLREHADTLAKAERSFGDAFTGEASELQEHMRLVDQNISYIGFVCSTEAPTVDSIADARDANRRVAGYVSLELAGEEDGDTPNSRAYFWYDSSKPRDDTKDGPSRPAFVVRSDKVTVYDSAESVGMFEALLHTSLRSKEVAERLKVDVSHLLIDHAESEKERYAIAVERKPGKVERTRARHQVMSFARTTQAAPQWQASELPTFDQLVAEDPMRFFELEYYSPEARAAELNLNSRLQAVSNMMMRQLTEGKIDESFIQSFTTQKMSAGHMVDRLNGYTVDLNGRTHIFRVATTDDERKVVKLSYQDEYSREHVFSYSVAQKVTCEYEDGPGEDYQVETFTPLHGQIDDAERLARSASGLSIEAWQALWSPAGTTEDASEDEVGTGQQYKKRRAAVNAGRTALSQ